MDVIFSHEIPLNLIFMRKQNLFERSQTPTEHHRVRYDVGSELYLTLKLDRGVREYINLLFKNTLAMSEKDHWEIVTISFTKID